MNKLKKLLKSGNAYYHLLQNRLSERQRLKDMVLFWVNI